MSQERLSERKHQENRSNYLTKARAAHAENLKQLRSDLHLTQQEMADSLNVVLRQYQRFESGDSAISSDHRKRILDTYYCDVYTGKQIRQGLSAAETKQIFDALDTIVSLLSQSLGVDFELRDNQG